MDTKNKATNDNDDVVVNLMAACQAHRGSKLMALINEFSADISQKRLLNILMELAEKPDLCTDFRVPISACLQLCSDMNCEPLLSEAGLIIYNASKIYSRRVDFTHELVENLIRSLSSADSQLKSLAKEPKELPPKKKIFKNIKKGPYEAEMIVKSFKSLTHGKRFESQNSSEDFSIQSRFFCNWSRYKKWRESRKIVEAENENHIHPALYKCSKIYDYENDEEIDSKRNYQLFTCHVEHRYNTLVSDLNFRMHFKVKDFLEAEEEEFECDASHGQKRHWPKLSKEYLSAYLSVEDIVLRNELGCGECPAKRDSGSFGVSNVSRLDRNDSGYDSTRESNSMDFSSESFALNSSTNSVGSNNSTPTIPPSDLDTSTPSIAASDLDNPTTPAPDLDSTPTILAPDPESTPTIPDNSRSEESSDLDETDEHDTAIPDDTTDLSLIRVHLPHLDDEGVYFNDLDETIQQMLSPHVVATDMFCDCGLKDPTDVLIKIDSLMMNFLGIDEDEQEIINLPATEAPAPAPVPTEITQNIFRIPVKYLRKTKIFDLPKEDFGLYKQERMGKRKNVEKVNECRAKVWKLETMNQTETEGNHYTRASSEESDFLGFPSESTPIAAKIGNRNSSIESVTSEDFLGFPSESTPIAAKIGNRNSSIESVTSEDFLGFEQTPVSFSELKARTISRDSGIGSERVANNQTEDSGIGSESVISIQTDVEREDCRQQLEEKLSDDSQLELNNVPEDKDDNTNQESRETLPVFSEEISSLQESSEIGQKIQNWHRYLKPILAKSRERHHFDIFELGTEIISKFTNNNVVNLDDVMQDQDPSYISRYFLSTLLLANQNNVSITLHDYDIDRPTELCNIELNLLSRKRHSVSNEDNIGILPKKRCVDAEPEETCEVTAPQRIIQPAKKKQKIESDDMDSGMGSMLSFSSSSLEITL